MKIKSKIKDYSLEFVDGLLEKKELLFLDLKCDNLFYFIDKEVCKIYENKLKKFIGGAPSFVIPAMEENKSYNKLADYYRMLIGGRFTRNDILVTFGGGILQDISGFIASTLYRGIKWVYFPTTLLAQADSCIGSKTSINFDDVKNLIGTFYPPDRIYIDHSFCKSLTDEYFNSGIGEIVKFHFMSNDKGYALLKKYLFSRDLRNSEYFKEIILSTLMIKKSYFEEDEFDSSRRNLLNYGHCFGHALESASDFKVSHGEAVIIGMGFANLLSLKRGIMKEETYDELEIILRRHYPGFNLSKLSAEALINFLKRDKKRIGKNLTMILSEDIGRQYKFDDILESEIKDTYADFVKNYTDIKKKG